MTARKNSPLHNRWHRKVEGQIRDCINHHPDWFSHIPNHMKFTFINSLAKRIVGEIVVECHMATMPDSVASNAAEIRREAMLMDKLASPVAAHASGCDGNGNPK